MGHPSKPVQSLATGQVWPSLRICSEETGIPYSRLQKGNGDIVPLPSGMPTPPNPKTREWTGEELRWLESQPLLSPGELWDRYVEYGIGRGWPYREPRGVAERYRIHTGRTHRRGKARPVRCTKTGQTWPSISEAAFDNDVSFRWLCESFAKHGKWRTLEPMDDAK